MNGKKFFAGIVACVAGLTAMAADPVAWIDLTNPVQSKGITHVIITDPNDEPFTEAAEKGGKQCRYIPQGKYGYFQVDDAIVSSAENNLIFKVTYFDEGYDGVQFQYNATEGNNYQNVGFNKTATNQWITITIAVTDASLRNTMNRQSDFRINERNYISRIEIYKGTMNPENEPAIKHNGGSAWSEFKGKSVAGYQAWFATGGRYDFWIHWGGGTRESDGTQWPRKNNHSFEIYPDITGYDDADLAQTGFADLGNGSSARLYNAASAGVINKHFEWMKECGIDGVALQRFIGKGLMSVNDSKEAVPVRVMKAAEKEQRIFYICYDITSSGLEDIWADLIKFDWVYNIEGAYQLTQSPAYATVNGKPVVQVWGTGFTDNHPGTAAETLNLINFLKSRGCYVIGGVPTYWRENKNDAKGPSHTEPQNQEAFTEVYKAYDMVSPWMVGRYSDNDGHDWFYNNLMQADKAYCDANGIDYMPCLLPGTSWATWNTGTLNGTPRRAGDFLWHQALNIKKLGVSNMYFSMFDEYDEGTALLSGGTDWSMIPTDSYFLTLGADGVWVSSDFYLRLAGDATAMLRGNKAATATVATPYSLGPVYYRNSFESRTTPYDYQNNQPRQTGTFPIDPCFYHPVVVASQNVNNAVVEISTEQAHNGQYAVKAQGTTTSAAGAIHYYKIAETKIPVVQNLELTFWKLNSNEQARYVFVDLITQSGKNLRDYGYTDQNNQSMHPGTAHGAVGEWEQFRCIVGKGELVGDTIVGIVMAYDQSLQGTYTAYIDDITIEIGDGQQQTGIEAIAAAQIDNLQIDAIYGMNGMRLSKDMNLPKGMYIIQQGNQYKKIVLQ